MFEIKSCCFCLSVKQGALILGSLALLDLVLHCIHFRLLGFALRIFVCTWFCAMLYKDTKWNRFGLFASAAVQVAIEFAMEIMFGLWVESSKQN